MFLIGFCGMALDAPLPRYGKTFRIGYFVQEADGFFDTAGSSQALDDTGFEANQIAVEFEYGIYADGTLVFKGIHLDQELFFDDQSYLSDGAGDFYLGYRQSMSPLGSLHRVVTELGVWMPGGYSDSAQPPMGSGGIDWQAVVSYGQESAAGRLGFEMDVGYRFRNEAPEDEVSFDMRTYAFWEDLAKFSAGYHVVESKNDNLIPYDILGYPTERGHQAVSAEIEFALSRHWSTTLCYGDVLRGRSQFETRSYGIRLVWRK